MKRKGKEARESSPLLFCHNGSRHPTGNISGQGGEGWSALYFSDPCSVEDLSAGCYSQRKRCSKKSGTLELSTESQNTTVSALGSNGDWYDADGQQTNCFQTSYCSQRCKLHCSFSSPRFLHCSLPSDSIRCHMLTKQRISTYHLLIQPMLDTTVGQIQIAASNKTQPRALPHT